jgi:thiosulfate dehydrogenase [quinone] large subunit
LRIIIGFLWFQQLLWKLPPDFGCTPTRDQGLCDWIGREIQSPLIPLYADFLRAIVLPNLPVLGWFIWLMEAVIAVSLLLGVFTRLGGALGFLQSMNLLIGLAAVPHEWYWTYLMLGLLNLLFALTAAGRWWGVDGAYLLPRLRAAAARGDPRAGWLLRLV